MYVCVYACVCMYVCLYCKVRFHNTCINENAKKHPVRPRPRPSDEEMDPQGNCGFALAAELTSLILEILKKIQLSHVIQ